MVHVTSHNMNALSQITPPPNKRIIIMLDQAPRYSSDERLIDGKLTSKSLQDYKALAMSFKQVLLTKRTIENNNTYIVPIWFCIVNCALIFSVNLYCVVNNYDTPIINLILLPLFSVYLVGALYNIEKLIKNIKIQQGNVLKV